MHPPAKIITLFQDRIKISVREGDRDRGESEILADLTRGLPLADRTAKRLLVPDSVCEFERPQLAYFLRECRRVLDANGMLDIRSRAETVQKGKERLDLSRLERLASMTGLTANPANNAFSEIVGSGQDTATAGLPPHCLITFTRKARMNTYSDLVSILIPAYNHAFFQQSLESALQQTHGNTEIIVCDDSGGDRIRDIIRRCSAPARVNYHRNPENLGARRNYLRCYELASGNYVKFLNDDDMLDSRCIERMVDILQRFDDITLVTSRRRLIDAKGSTLPDIPPTRPLVASDSIIQGSCASYIMLQSQLNFIGEPTTAMFRREDINDQQPDIMSFAGRPVMANLDVAMWLNLLYRGDLAYLVEPLSCFRIHGAQEQQKRSVRDLCLAAWQQVTDDASQLGMLETSNRFGRIRRIAPPVKS
jgi:hypothetical protein